MQVYIRQLLLCATALGSTAHALTAHPYERWEPAGPGDVRSPCPGLNLMANHHIIPHDGKGLTVSHLTQTMMDVFNFDQELASFFANFGLSHSPDPDSGKFKLDDLDKHNAIEHDASLSRADYYFGDDHSFNWPNWASVLKFIAREPIVTQKNAALARQHREETEAKRNPTFNFTGTLRHNSFSESAIYLSALGSPIVGEAKTIYVREFFEKERLPTRFGWRKTEPATSFDTLETLIIKLANITGSDIGTNPGAGNSKV